MIRRRSRSSSSSRSSSRSCRSSSWSSCCSPSRSTTDTGGMSVLRLEGKNAIRMAVSRQVARRILECQLFRHYGRLLRLLFIPRAGVLCFICGFCFGGGSLFFLLCVSACPFFGGTKGKRSKSRGRRMEKRRKMKKKTDRAVIQRQIVEKPHNYRESRETTHQKQKQKQK